MSRGLNNNNPGNIRKSNDVFLGEKIPSSDVAFKQFTHIKYGYRAMFVTIGTYICNGYNTLEKIVARWAPSSENNTAAYVQAVEKWSKVNRSKTLSLKNGKEVIKIVSAMSRFENGKVANEDDVKAGFIIQNKFSIDDTDK